MTREDFINDICCWEQLLEFCYDEDCDICKDIYSASQRDDYIDEYQISAWASENTWQDLFDILNSIPTGYEYYYHDDCDDWVPADDDLFYDMKDYVLTWMDDGGWWDDDRNDEENDYDDTCDSTEDENDEDMSPVESDVPISDLLEFCNNSLKSIRILKQQEAAQAEKEFEDFVMNCIPDFD